MKINRKNIRSTRPSILNELPKERAKDFEKFDLFLAEYFAKLLKDQNREIKQKKIFFDIEYISDIKDSLDRMKIKVYEILQYLPDSLLEYYQNNATKDEKILRAEYSIPLSQDAVHNVFFETLDTYLLDLGLLLSYGYEEFCVAYPYAIKQYLVRYFLLQKKEQPKNPKDLKMIEWLTKHSDDFETHLDLTDFDQMIPTSELTFNILKDWFGLEIDQTSFDLIKTIYLDPTTKHNTIAYIKPNPDEEDQWLIEFNGHAIVETFESITIDDKLLIELDIAIIPKLFGQEIANLIRNHAEYITIDIYEISGAFTYGEMPSDSVFEMYDFTHNERVSTINTLLEIKDVSDLVIDHLTTTGKCTEIDLAQEIEELDIAFHTSILIFETT